MLFRSDAPKEVIIILVEKSILKPIKDAMVKAGDLNRPGTGILFTLPVSSVIGLTYREE